MILGGVASGKSVRAVERAKSSGKGVVFVGTAPGQDPEWEARIAACRAARPAEWRTFEAAGKIAGLLRVIASTADVVVLDSVSHLVANLLRGGASPAEIETEIADLIETAADAKPVFLLTTEEVGLGLAGDSAAGRRFREIVGRMNQRLAAAAQTVEWLVAGLPLPLKRPR